MIFEGNSGFRPVSFLVTLNGLSDGTVSVHWSTSDGTATTGDNDYVPGSGDLNFSFGQIAKVVTVFVRGDTKVEPNETFFVNFSSNNSGAVMNSGDDQVSVTILNDDRRF